MKKEQIIKRLQWSIEERDWEAVKLLKGDLEAYYDEWIVEQYNRNGSVKEQIIDVKDISTT